MDSMARVTEPLASSSLKVLSFESTLYVLMDGRWRYHERDKSHLGGPAYTGNCFVFSHTLSRSRIRHRYIYRRLRRSRTRKFSYSHRITHSLPSLVARNISYTNHLIYFYVCRMSYRIVSYFTRRVHASTDDTKVQETPERCLENFTTSFKRLHCPCIRIFSVYKYVCVRVYVCFSQ